MKNLRIFILLVVSGFVLCMKPGAPLTIYVFLQADCPCVYSHKDSFGSLLKKYSDKVNFQMVFVGKNDTKTKMTELLKQLDWKVSFARDEHLKLTNLYRPKVSTDCIVLDKNHFVIYRGAIDDAVKNMGMVKNFYLKEVIDAALLHKPVPYTNVAGTGCTLM
ncbi:MAG: hypothetical protein ACXVPN_04325 [Bacteroidia bacterium]